MIIFNSPSQEEKTIIPDLNDIENHSLSKNIKLLIEKITNWTPDSSDWIVLSQDDELYKLIDSKAEPKRKFSGIPEVIRIETDVYSFSHFLHSNPKKNFWNYIDKFSINKRLCIADPCYLKLNSYDDFNYLTRTKDEFYAFCYMIEAYIADVMIINSKMYHDLDRKILNLNIENFNELKVLGVDAGCITFCEFKPFMLQEEESESFEKWYEDEICYKCRNKAYSISNGGIVVSSGYGDGWYSLMKYENKESNHIAYYINFLNNEEHDEN